MNTFPPIFTAAAIAFVCGVAAGIASIWVAKGG